MKASYDAHQGDFDYLLGDWAFPSVSREYGKGGGYWSAVRLAEGAQGLDEYRIVGDSGQTYYASSTLRAYNAILDQWELVSAESGTGVQNLGTGHRVGAEMHVEQRFGASSPTPARWRGAGRRGYSRLVWPLSGCPCRAWESTSARTCSRARSSTATSARAPGPRPGTTYVPVGGRSPAGVRAGPIMAARPRLRTSGSRSSARLSRRACRRRRARSGHH